ncbi:MAG: type II toxin-antitoxin system VapB family antitoxin [Deltaproteobacteria bacterium]|nr:type II toxin-antitoxin system VapB family antitoxin [Deltaproteobacteria bacterium]
MKNKNTVHTTINISADLMKRAMKVFKGKTKTEIIHECLENSVRNYEVVDFFKKNAGKSKVVDYER